jgi:hypothetical protein
MYVSKGDVGAFFGAVFLSFYFLLPPLLSLVHASMSRMKHNVLLVVARGE